MPRKGRSYGTLCFVCRKVIDSAERVQVNKARVEFKHIISSVHRLASLHEECWYKLETIINRTHAMEDVDGR